MSKTDPEAMSLTLWILAPEGEASGKIQGRV